MDRFLKILFFALIVKPIVLIVLGLNLRHRERLPKFGPAIIAANHNSHMDTLVLMCLYPLSQIHKIRPVAAADYFLSNRFMSWFSTKVIGIIPLQRKGSAERETLFNECSKAMRNGDILIIFPEGSRGEPEQLSAIKKGVYHLSLTEVSTPVIPVVMRGLGRILPKGENMLVPYNCDVIIGNELPRYNNADEFVKGIAQIYNELFSECVTKVE